MNQIIDEAIVLRRINYGESDRVVTLLTKQNGKITVFAKGVRKQKSRLSGGIELLSVSEVGYIAGKSELNTLTSARLLKHYEHIVKDMDKTNQTFEALKKIDRLSDDNHGQEYFELLQTYLAALNDESYDHKVVEVWLGLQLLKTAGVLGQVEVRTADEDEPADLYNFNYDEQFFSGHDSGAFSKNDIKLMKILSKSSAPVRVQNDSVSVASLIQVTKNLFAMNLA